MVYLVRPGCSFINAISNQIAISIINVILSLKYMIMFFPQVLFSTVLKHITLMDARLFRFSNFTHNKKGIDWQLIYVSSFISYINDVIIASL